MDIVGRGLVTDGNPFRDSRRAIKCCEFTLGLEKSLLPTVGGSKPPPNNEILKIAR